LSIGRDATNRTGFHFMERYMEHLVCIFCGGDAEIKGR
jgi:hypothetical protein